MVVLGNSASLADIPPRHPASPRLAIPLASLRTPLLSFLLHLGEAGVFCTSLFHLPLLLFICMHAACHLRCVGEDMRLLVNVGTHGPSSSEPL
jgi:hypothetical protein